MRSADPTLVLFDCDGVLVDSEYLVVEVEAALFNEVGIPLTADEIIERFVGLSERSMLDAILADGHVLPDGFAEEKASRIAAAFATDLEAVAGIESVLAVLVAAEVPRAVASSSALDRVRRSLELTGLARHVEPNLYSAQMVRRGKPAPDLFLLAAGDLGYEPGRCVVIEDSPHGVEAGVAAGMSVIGFTAGRHARPDLAERLRVAGADVIASNAVELETILRARMLTAG